MAEHVDQSEESTGEQGDGDRQRSPAYPSIPLGSALAKIDTIWKADKGSAGTMEVIALHLETSCKSSGFLQTISSLLRYGLLDELEGKPRKLRISKVARDIILLPEDDPRRAAAIKAVALTPKVFKEIWDEHGADLPSDQNLVYELVTSRHFRQSTAEDVIRQYKKTISFAKLHAEDKIGEPERMAANAPNGEMKPPGDRMQPQTGQSEPPSLETKNFPLDFIGGKKGMLYVPAVMTHKDFDLLKLQMDHYLMLLKMTSVENGEAKPEN